MSKRSLVPAHGGDDNVITPEAYAVAIVQHFRPGGTMLDPAAGLIDKPFAEAMSKLRAGYVAQCEIREGTDFFQWNDPVDWIVTNPPWSKFRLFMSHAMRYADDIVFLATMNHFMTRARILEREKMGFAVVEFLMLPTPPKPWPQSGFQLVAGWVRRGWQGPTVFSKPKEPITP